MTNHLTNWGLPIFQNLLFKSLAQSWIPASSKLPKTILLVIPFELLISVDLWLLRVWFQTSKSIGVIILGNLKNKTKMLGLKPPSSSRTPNLQQWGKKNICQTHNLHLADLISAANRSRSNPIPPHITPIYSPKSSVVIITIFTIATMITMYN